MHCILMAGIGGPLGGVSGQPGQRTMRALFDPLGQVGHGHESVFLHGQAGHRTLKVQKDRLWSVTVHSTQ